MNIAQPPKDQMESLILKLHSKMKNLENKYIDLANFYKTELVSGTSKSKRTSRLSSKSPQREQLDLRQEGAIFNALKHEKDNLEFEL